MKEDLIKTGFIQNLCKDQLMNLKEFDITYYKHTVKFLPFRRFLPFKNEALGMLQILIWYKVRI